MTDLTDKQEFNFALQNAVTGTVGAKVPVHFIQGDITDAAVDAIVVPQFPHVSSPLGIGAALRKAGAEDGMEAYNDLLKRVGPQIDGAVFVSDSGMASTPHLLHTTVINDQQPQNQADRIRTGLYNALVAAEAEGFKNIVTPALGTGNGLTGEESAKAMLSALDKYSRRKSSKKIKVNIVLYKDPAMEKAFQQVLVSESYKEVQSPNPFLTMPQDLFANKGFADKIAASAAAFTPSGGASGVKELSREARGFLFSFFNQAAMHFSDSVKPIEKGLAEAVMPPPGSLAFDFLRASAAARVGTLQEVNTAIGDLVKKAAKTTDPVLKDALEDIRHEQALFYNGQVKKNKKLQADLGSYAAGIF